MRSYLNISSFIFLRFLMFTSIFHTESLVKMSNSSWFSRIFTLQSFSWFCINSFWLFLRCICKNIPTRVREFFYNYRIWKFSKFQIFSFPFLKFIHFKITTNSFKYSLVQQFFETHFLKSNYRVVRGYIFKKI